MRLCDVSNMHPAVARPFEWRDTPEMVINNGIPEPSTGRCKFARVFGLVNDGLILLAGAVNGRKGI
jgi:hypothetical protein